MALLDFSQVASPVPLPRERPQAPPLPRPRPQTGLDWSAVASPAPTAGYDLDKPIADQVPKTTGLDWSAVASPAPVYGSAPVPPVGGGVNPMVAEKPPTTQGAGAALVDRIYGDVSDVGKAAVDAFLDTPSVMPAGTLGPTFRGRVNEALLAPFAGAVDLMNATLSAGGAGFSEAFGKAVKAVNDVTDSGAAGDPEAAKREAANFFNFLLTERGMTHIGRPPEGGVAAPPLPLTPEVYDFLQKARETQPPGPPSRGEGINAMARAYDKRPALPPPGYVAPLAPATEVPNAPPAAPSVLPVKPVPVPPNSLSQGSDTGVSGTPPVASPPVAPAPEAAAEAPPPVAPSVIAVAPRSPEQVTPPSAPETAAPLTSPEPGVPAAEAKPPRPPAPATETAAPPSVIPLGPPAAEPGSPAAPVKVKTAEDLATATARVEQPPTQAHADEGEYRHGHISVQGIDIAIETPKGGMRRGVGKDGKPWEIRSPAAYGRIKKTVGADGEQVDVYVGDKPQASKVYVIDQVDADTKAGDEHKVLLGFPSRMAAVQVYRRAFSDNRGGERIGGVTEMTVPEFKDWLKNGDTTKPIAGKAPEGATPPAEVKAEAQKLSRPYSDWQEKIAAFDARNAPDAAYRSILSTGAKEPLKKGETWRGRVQGYIDKAAAETLPAQPVKPNVEKTPVAETPLWTDLGPNAAGDMVQVKSGSSGRAKSGLRSFVKNGVRQSEPVRILPNGNAAPRADRGEWTLASEKETVPFPPAAKPEAKPSGVPWQDAKPGDALEDGSILVEKKIDRKARAQELADATPGGRMLADGAKHWAVTRSAEAPQKPASATESPAAPTPAPKPEAAPPAAEPAAEGEPGVALARAIKTIMAQRNVTMKEALVEAAKAYGGTLAEGKFDRKDVYDAIELAVNMRVRSSAMLRVDDGDWKRANEGRPSGGFEEYPPGVPPDWNMPWISGVNLYEEAARRVPGNHIDLGEMQWERGPKGAQMQDYVTANGRLHHVEFAVGIDENGETWFNGYGLRSSTGMTGRFAEALEDQRNQIVVHHNHPSNGGFSQADIAFLGYPGMKALWAHGHEGFVGRAELSPLAKQRMAGGNIDKRMATMQAAYKLAATAIYDPISAAVKTSGNGLRSDERYAAMKASGDEAYAYNSHIIASILRDGGLIDYRSSLDNGASAKGVYDFIAWTGIKPYIDKAARQVREVMNNGQTAAANARQPEPLRHPGDVGAVFEGRAEAIRRLPREKWDVAVRARNAEAQGQGTGGRVRERLSLREDGDVPRSEYNDILRGVIDGEETPPLTRAQARARRQAEKEFPVVQRMALDKTTRQLAARAEEVAQMANKFVAALKSAKIKTDAQKFALHQKITKFQENVSHPENQPALTPTERKLYDEHYKPLFDLHNEIYHDIMAFKGHMTEEQRAEFEFMANPEYVHHVVQGKGSKYDRIASETGFGPIMGRRRGGDARRALPISASAIKSSAFYALENDRTGKRMILSQGDGRATHKWTGGERSAGPTVKLEIGNGIDAKNGDHWTVQRAKLGEKREHAPVDYYQNVYATTADSVLALEHAKLGLEYFDALTKTPEWAHMATKKFPPPDGWKQIDRAPLQGWYLHPDLYQPLIDFYGGEPILNLSGTWLEGLNHLATGSIFISPFPHVWNVANHAYIERGWDWLSAPAYGRLVVTGTQAMKSVMTRDARYIQMMRDGAPMFYSNSRNTNLIQHIFDRVGAEMEAEKPGGFWHQVAKAFDYPSPAAIIPWFYKEVNRGMWMMGDMMMAQRIMELQWKSGLRPAVSQEAAIKRARQHIPDYVVPPKVAGSRILSRVLQDMMLTMFGRYRYSQYKTFFHDANQTIGRSKSAAERGAAIGRLLMAYVAWTVLYPMLDEYLQKILGIPDAQIVRGGPFHIVENAQRLRQDGARGIPRFLFTTFIPSPVTTIAIQMLANHELWKSAFGYYAPPIIGPKDTVAQGLRHEAEAVAGALGVGSSIRQIATGGAGRVIGQQFGVKIPYTKPPPR